MKPLFSTFIFLSLFVFTDTVRSETPQDSTNDKKTHTKDKSTDDSTANTDNDKAAPGSSKDTTDKKDTPDTDTETDSDTESDTGETVMYFPREIDDDPYARESAPASSAKTQTVPVEKPSTPTAAAVNPPWVASPDTENASSPTPDEENAGVTYLPPPPPPPSDIAEETVPTNPCDAVECSGRGACVLKGGEPTCACYRGFVPDMVNGLSCVPENPFSPPIQQWDKNAYYLNLSIALGEFDIRPALHEYEAKRATGETKASFTGYLRRHFKRTQNFGTAALSVGIPAFAAGLALHMMYAGYPDKNGYLGGAVLLDIFGLGLIGTGAALLATGSIRIQKLDKFEKVARRKISRAKWCPPNLVLAPNAALFSLGLQFL